MTHHHVIAEDGGQFHIGMRSGTKTACKKQETD
jgi:hypothetical protein